jgi:NAD(P)-dependent dehydrogenase (short-subunit alcohol dehydrogenase family)
MDLGFSGQAVIVTGGSSNIGRAIVRAFAREGAGVVIADIDAEQGRRSAEQAQGDGGKALLVPTDVTDPEQCRIMAEQALEAFGRLDVLVNCAGWVYDRPFIEKPRAEWEREIAVNFWGVINAIRAVTDHMMAARRGKIVSIASVTGRVGERREVVYSGAKGAVIAMTKSLAKELGPYNINVNTVCPGTILPATTDEIGEESMWRSGGLYERITPETRERMLKAYPLRRLGKAADIAGAVLFLASDMAGWITGQALSVDGGYTMV